MFTKAVLFVTALIAITGFAKVAHAVTFEAPVTFSMTISVTSPQPETTTTAGTDYKAKLTAFKFTNRDYLQTLVDDNVIPSLLGWKLVARWNAGDTPADFTFHLVKEGSTAIAMDDENGFSVDFGAVAAGYSERWKDDTMVSGGGTVKFATVFNMDNEGETFQLSGIGTATYAIKSWTPDDAPSLSFTSLKLNLLGGVITSDLEGVVEMTLTIGKPVILQGATSSGGGGVPPTTNPGGGGITIVSPSS